MRLIYTLIIASAVGSAGVSAVRTILTNHPTEAAKVEPAIGTIIRLYRRDKAAAIVLMERASVSCLPELSKIASRKLRTVIPTIMAHAIASKVIGEKLDKAKFRKHIIEKILTPATRDANLADLEVMNTILSKQSSDKGAVIDCVITTVAQLSRSESPSQPKKLLEGVELRGT